MGNNPAAAITPPASLFRTSTLRRGSTSKQVHITTNHVDGFYLTGDKVNGSVKIPSSFIHNNWPTNSTRRSSELVHKRSLRNPLTVELVGDAIYSAEIDIAADSDGHVKHRVNICRQRSMVSMHSDKTEDDNQTQLSLMSGTFQISIPEGLPPSITGSGTPSIVYHLELSLSSARSRYQIPITISPRGLSVDPLLDLPIKQSMMNQHHLCLRGSLIKRFYRPAEQIPVQIEIENPQQRSIRSIRVRLLQCYRVHHDLRHTAIDGKEWTFENGTMLSQREWSGEAFLQLPEHGLAASFPTNLVGTTRTIECELEYRILIELHEKKGDNIDLTLSSFYVTHENKN